MTRAFSSGMTLIGDALEAEAGQYLKSVVRQGHSLCNVCALPTSGWDRCWQCNQHVRTGLPLADRVGSLVYAIEPDTQAYLTVRNYKAERPGPGLPKRMQQLLAVGLRGHVRCLASVADSPVSAWGCVPSRKGRTALATLLDNMASEPLLPISLNGIPELRELDPDAWSVGRVPPPRRHALVIDDSWVTGASAQSVASALKREGFRQVSILTVARVLKTNHSDVKEFVTQTLPQLEFDWRTCPWTASGVCP